MSSPKLGTWGRGYRVCLGPGPCLQGACWGYKMTLICDSKKRKGSSYVSGQREHALVGMRRIRVVSSSSEELRGAGQSVYSPTPCRQCVNRGERWDRAQDSPFLPLNTGCELELERKERCVLQGLHVACGVLLGPCRMWPGCLVLQIVSWKRGTYTFLVSWGWV